jgi:predicted RNase H-like HicB family nuclease
MRELIFEVTQEADGGYWAECLTDTIVTEGDTWEELRQNVREVVKAFYFDQPDKLPTTLRLLPSPRLPDQRGCTARSSARSHDQSTLEPPPAGFRHP